MAEKIKLTKTGYQEAKDKLDYLRTEKREEIKAALVAARELGDLSENSEYDEARNEQAKVEAEIVELEQLLENAEILGDDEIEEGKVGLGSCVKVQTNGREVTYYIVSSNEVNAFENKISNMSVIGAALIGKRAGDEIEVKTIAGQVKLKVLEVSRAK